MATVLPVIESRLVVQWRLQAAVESGASAFLSRRKTSTTTVPETAEQSVYAPFLNVAIQLGCHNTGMKTVRSHSSTYSQWSSV